MSTVKLRAHWRGRRTPRCGQWLMARRGRTAYEIVEAIRIGGVGVAYQWRLTCVRHAPTEIPPGAIVHNWIWDKRARSRAP